MYLSFYKRKRRRYLRGVIVVLCIGLTVLSGLYAIRKISFTDRRHEDISKEPPEQTEEALKTSEPPKLRTVSEGIMQTVYAYSCGHTEEEEKAIPASYLGKTAEEILKEFNNIESISYDGNILSVSMHINADCMNHYTARLYGNTIRIFPTANPDAAEREFDVDLNYFYPEEIRELKNGITLNSKDEMLEFIENFQS